MASASAIGCAVVALYIGSSVVFGNRASLLYI